MQAWHQEGRWPRPKLLGKEKILGREGFHLNQKEDTGWNRAIKEDGKVFLFSYCLEYEHRGLEYAELLLPSEHYNQAHLLPVIGNTSNLHSSFSTFSGENEAKRNHGFLYLIDFMSPPSPCSFLLFPFPVGKGRNNGIELFYFIVWVYCKFVV